MNVCHVKLCYFPNIKISLKFLEITLKPDNKVILQKDVEGNSSSLNRDLCVSIDRLIWTSPFAK